MKDEEATFARIAAVVKSERENAGLSQIDVAIQVNITPQALHIIEKTGRTSVITLLRICSCLLIDPTTLYRTGAQ